MKGSLRRKIEILGLVLNSHKKYTLADMTWIFECEELTIKRYMQQYRAEGIEREGYWLAKEVPANYK
ncbi:MAG: hypothetical protein JEY94_10210 [Melioribacteraceae bacterium]|nr:hypothetical protein [Melioribacteraceae bacterium]